MENIVLLIQTVLAIIFSILILIQPRGAGLGRAFGGGGSSFTRRGVEKALFRFTFIVSGLFVVASALGLLF